MLRTRIRRTAVPLGAVCASLMAVPATAQVTLNYSTPPPAPPTTVLSYSDTTIGGPTFNRPLTGTPPTATSTVGTAVPYHARTFTVAQTGAYNFLSLGTTPANWDNFTVLYQNSFNPASPLSNALRANDDFTTIGRAGFNGVSLTAGTSYIWVTTGFGNNNAGVFTNTLTTVGSSATDIPDNNPAGVSLNINVPDFGYITSLNSVSLLGLNHTWAGDLVATLSHGGQTTTLFDRVGRTATSTAGNSADFTGDYRFVPGGPALPASGTIAPGTYGIAANPDGNSPFAANFSIFNKMELNGGWTLNLSDRAALDTGRIGGFLISVTVVPEPGTVALFVGVGIAGIGLLRRRSR